MLRIAFTLLLFLAWHFPTTFFVPAGSPYEKGWLVWPFGQQSRPVLDAIAGSVIAPASPTVTTNPSVALAAAGIASLAFIVAAGSLWGIVIPGSWFQPAVTVGAVSSVILFVVYMSPLALIPLAVDVVLLWGVATQGWSVPQLVGA